MTKPVLLYYCQYTDGADGLVRPFTIASRLTHRFRVVIMNGGLPSPGMRMPEKIEYIQLPPLRAHINRSNGGTDAPVATQHELTVRREMIARKQEELKPGVILIESYPFGQRSFDDEPISLIETARHSTSAGPFIICSVRDIMADTRFDKESSDDRIAEILDANFDAVIVHSDPAFARLQEFFQSRNTLAVPVYHSGFVVRDRVNALPQSMKQERVLVSAGSGSEGARLYRAAVEAHHLLWDVDRLPMTIITGPDLPHPELRRLQEQVREMPDLELKRSVPDFGAELATVRWAVCQCDYNTAVDVLASGVSALLMPENDDQRSEQMERLQRLNRWRLARILMPRHLNGASLANSIQQLVKFRPPANKFNMDGAEITANLVYDLSLSRSTRLGNMASPGNSDQPWVH